VRGGEGLQGNCHRTNLVKYDPKFPTSLLYLPTYLGTHFDVAVTVSPRGLV